MNIYIINEVLSDITYGMAVIAASDLSECRAIFEDHFRLKMDELAGTGLDEFDEAIVNNSSRFYLPITVFKLVSSLTLMGPSSNSHPPVNTGVHL